MSEARELLKEILEQHDKGFLEAHNTRARVLLKRINDYLVSKEVEEYLDKPEPEPVAWMCPDDPDINTAFSWKRLAICKTKGCFKKPVPVYAEPPARKPLSEDEITEFANKHLIACSQYITCGETWYEGEIEFARAIEKAHGIEG